MVLASITSSAVLYLCTNSDIGGSSKDGVPECVCVCVCMCVCVCVCVCDEHEETGHHITRDKGIVYI